MFPWEGISEFVAVADTNSFTQAAKRLGISTAQVSRQVRNLEDRLATRLLYRTTRKVSLTEAGALYYQHSRSVLEALEAAEQAVSSLQEAPQGKIRITAPVTYGEDVIVPLVNTFLSRYPRLDITVQLTNQTVDLIEGGYDLAIRLGRLKDSSLAARKLASRTLHVCASPDYLKRNGCPHTLNELDRHNCLLGSNDFWRFRESGRERLMRVQGNLRCNSGKSLADAALKGIGLVQLPDYYVQHHLDSGALLPMLENFREPEEGIWAVFPHNRHLSPKIRMLLDHLVSATAEG